MDFYELQELSVDYCMNAGSPQLMNGHLTTIQGYKRLRKSCLQTILEVMTAALPT